MAAKRVATLESHLTYRRPANEDAEQLVDDASMVKRLKKMLAFPDEGKDAQWVMQLPGPLAAGVKRTDVLLEVLESMLRGTEHVLWEEYQRKYGGDQGLAANLVLPCPRFSREEDFKKVQNPAIQNNVVVCDPEDCLRLVQKHLQKQGNFTPAFLRSVISTTDNDHWRAQRKELTPAFMPLTSLRKIFPISLKRAKDCVDKLWVESESGTREVEMNEFLLHEAMAQLRLALFGETEELMLEINKPYRDAMAGRTPDTLSEVRRLHDKMIGNMQPGCPAATRSQGPLSQRMAQSGCPADKHTLLGNAGIFSFAGHDTTGHTMTWLLYELSKNPVHQKALPAEVDGLWRKIEGEGRDLEYDDFKNLPFMTRCIMETLRLWPAVPNGTFRVLEEEDWVKGKGGEKVWLPKGTNVQISTWSRHRNPVLWGEDVEVWNPNREFAPAELWDHEVFSSKNPYTLRFSPFTFPPRDCIGRNFAQMEMRVIMMHLLRRFEFIASPVNAYNGKEFQGINYGTLAPQNALYPAMVKRNRTMGFGVGAKTATGMYLHPRPRQ